jgi:hypothetical protein
MWLAQFVCAPQFFKTPMGLCGHTVFYPVHKLVYVIIIISTLQLVPLSFCRMRQRVKQAVNAGYKSPGIWSRLMTSLLMSRSIRLSDVTSTLTTTIYDLHADTLHTLWSPWELCLARYWCCGCFGTGGNIGHPTLQQKLRHSGCGWWLRKCVEN